MQEKLPADPGLSGHARLYFLDWVRIAAFAWLVAFHVGMYYVTWDYHIKSPFAGNWLEPFMRLSSPWRMTLLFFVSGAATAFMLRGGASGALLANRAKRLLLPLLFGILVIVPPQSYVEVVQRFAYAGSFADFMQLYLTGYSKFCSKSGPCLILPTWNHLWFLPYLFFYTAVLWLVLRRYPAGLEALAARVGGALHGARLIVLPILFFAVARVILGPLFGITHALVDDWYAHAQYGAAFTLGAAMARANALYWQRFVAVRWLALLLTMAAWAALVTVLNFKLPVHWANLDGWQVSRLGIALGGAVAHAIMQWCAIVATLGFAARHLNHENAARRYLTEAVFPVYIVHQTLILLCAIALLPLALRPLVEMPLLIVVTFVFSFGIFEIVRRIGWLRPWFGLTAALALTAASAHAQAVPTIAPISTTSPLGEWWTPGFSARVKLERCGDAICGNIVWVWDENPATIADSKPLLGRKVVEAMRHEGPTSATRWSGGRLYNPEDGRDYKGSLTLASANRLTVDGCVLMICKSQTWRRYDAQRSPPVAMP